jgi:hypothetical protein
MFLLSSPSKLRGSRFKKKLFRPGFLNRQVAFFVKKNGARPNLYHKTSVSRFAHTGLLKLDTKIVKWYFFCVDLFVLNTRYAAVFKNASGAYFSSPLVEAIRLGSRVSWLRNSYKKFFFLSVGVIARLRFLKLATLVCNVGYDKPVFATAHGTYAKVRMVRPKCVTIVLPSGEWREMTASAAGVVGRNAGAGKYKEVLGKASSYRRNIKRVIVRSCAKNPVDHPNGGRTRGKRLFKTP